MEILKHHSLFDNDYKAFRIRLNFLINQVMDIHGYIRQQIFSLLCELQLQINEFQAQINRWQIQIIKHKFYIACNYNTLQYFRFGSIEQRKYYYLSFNSKAKVNTHMNICLLGTAVISKNKTENQTQCNSNVRLILCYNIVILERYGQTQAIINHYQFNNNELIFRSRICYPELFFVNN
ncbi:Hypothetical_protein [Hexamita inflata]|uniref:Hypothetical_protein n=1 Tax=Hexamita inflata TaxID=28002 RepID=A0AA86PBI9_9EUKA|nr:Hypothetical protein HINF_LOCUS22073 [Hexamita inflata]